LPGGRKPGRERLEKPVEGDAGVGLAGDEGPVDGGEREAR